MTNVWDLIHAFPYLSFFAFCFASTCFTLICGFVLHTMDQRDRNATLLKVRNAELDAGRNLQ